MKTKQSAALFLFSLLIPLSFVLIVLSWPFVEIWLSENKPGISAVAGGVNLTFIATFTFILIALFILFAFVLWRRTKLR